MFKNGIFTIPIINSMIFTTKNNEHAIFGNTITNVKEKWKGFKKEIAKNDGKIFGENGAFAALFSSRKSILPELLDDFEAFKDLYNESSLSAQVLAENLGGVDDRIVNYAKTCKNGELTTEGFRKSVESMTLSAKAATVATKALSLAGNMLLMWGISEAIQLIYSCATASDRLRESASELGSAFSSTQAEINDYKNRINDLYKTINDNSSSYEETYTARQNLLSIQDEMIEKFGKEAEAVKLVTDAINGETSSLDTLTQKKWQETKNTFSHDTDRSWTEKFGDNWANFWSGSSDNFDRMVNEMEDTEVSFLITPRYRDETYKAFYDKLQEDYNASHTFTTRGEMFTISGDLDDIYKQLKNIQSLAKDMGLDDSALTDLARQTESTKSTLETYEEIYGQHVLYDKILDGDVYEESFREINDAYKKYQEAFATGDEEAIEKAKQSFAEIVQSATEGINDQSVVDYFNHMYPDLQETVGSWEFEVAFKTAVEDDSDHFEEDVTNALGSFQKTEDLKNYGSLVKTIDYDTATDDQKEMIDNYWALKEVADEYSLTMDQLIDKLVQMGFIQSQTKQDLLDKLMPKQNRLTAGIFSALGNNTSQADSATVTEWVNSLDEEEATLANSKEFEQALEDQKDKLNGATLSANDYETALSFPVWNILKQQETPHRLY